MADVTPELVLQVLEPRWAKKTKTMKDLRGRIAKVLNFAAVKGYRPKGPNPAAWKDNLEVSLARPSKVTSVVNHPALPYAKVGAFMARLRKDPSFKARALEFIILCASRAGEVLGARWREIDLKARLWTIPAERMKMRKEHNVALSEAACAILQAIKGDKPPTRLRPVCAGVHQSGRPEGVQDRSPEARPSPSARHARGYSAWVQIVLPRLGFR